MEKIKSASDFATQLKEAWYDPKFKFQDCVALIQERDRHICDQQQEISLKEYAKHYAGSEEDYMPECIYNSLKNAPYPEGIIKKEE